MLWEQSRWVKCGVQDKAEDRVFREQWDMVRWDKEDHDDGVGCEPRHKESSCSTLKEHLVKHRDLS